MLLKENIKYQRNSINALVNGTSTLLNNGEKNSLFIFKSPTGSGKTVMMAKYIQELVRESEQDFCFVWISIGTGDLHVQSKSKLESIFSGSPTVSLLEEDYFGSRKEISSNEVVVVNWEKIRQREEGSGEWKNKLMKGGDRLNFRDVLANTRYSGRKIILIIDESHIGKGSQRTEEIKKEVDADQLIELSATPTIPDNFQDLVFDGKAGYHKVDVKEVIEAEMIKKQLIVNDGLKAEESAVMDRELLEQAYNKREELKKAFEYEGSSVNPLVLIQLPNSEEGDRKKEFILNLLKEKGLTIKERKVAIWLSGEENKENLESISNPTDSVDFLLFKQAIDTGWDCPRAQVLLKYRETTSETFERQTLGRILRMPEQKHYNQEILNQSYIYTDYLGRILDIVDEDFDYPEQLLKDVTLFAKEDYESFVLNSSFIQRKRKDLVKEALEASFTSVIHDKGIERFKYEENQETLDVNIDVTKLTEEIIAEVPIETADVLEKNKIEGGTVKFQLDSRRTQTLFERLINSHSRTIGSDPKKAFNILKEKMYVLIGSYITDLNSLQNMLVDVQRIFILNYEKVFSKFLLDVMAKYKDIQLNDLVHVTVEHGVVYTIPQTLSVSSDSNEEVSLENYYYDKCYLSKERLQPEKSFEMFIQEHIDFIKFWVKNGDSGKDHFCIPYNLNREIKGFYPDYLIQFVDGRIGLFETKDKHDDSDNTTAKAEVLQSYINTENEKGMNLIGGIVADFGRIDAPYLKMNQNDKFTTNETEWEDLDEIFNPTLS